MTSIRFDILRLQGYWVLVDSRSSIQEKFLTSEEAMSAASERVAKASKAGDEALIYRWPRDGGQPVQL